MIEIRAANPWTCLSEGRRFFWVRYMRPPKSGSVARVPPPNLLSECGCCLLDPCVLCCKPSGGESEAVVYIEGICLPEACDKPPPLFFPHTIQHLQHLEFTPKLMPWWAHPWAIPRLEDFACIGVALLLITGFARVLRALRVVLGASVDPKQAADCARRHMAPDVLRIIATVMAVSLHTKVLRKRKVYGSLSTSIFLALGVHLNKEAWRSNTLDGFKSLGWKGLKETPLLLLGCLAWQLALPPGDWSWYLTFRTPVYVNRLWDEAMVCRHQAGAHAALG